MNKNLRTAEPRPNSSAETPWEFWIDVGGTFTDCLARRPDGSLVRHKLLSSGRIKGTVEPRSYGLRIIDALRANDPPNVWRGYRCELLAADGTKLAAYQVTGSQAGELTLDQPLEQLSDVARNYELASTDDAPLVAIRYLLGLPNEAPLPPIHVRLGTTRGTNALLTRRGTPTALVITAGFADLLEIGYQDRPRLFDLTIHKAPPLYQRVVEVPERIATDGTVLEPLDMEVVRRRLEAVRAEGIEAVAICLLNAFEHPRHEQQVGELARQLGFLDVSLSHEVAPLIKAVSRGETTVANAYLNPVLQSYLRGIDAQLAAGALRVMTSAGGLVAAQQFAGKDSILSGPAGGVVGFSRVAQAAGFSRAIGFDMGGTSTDVSRFDGTYELEYEARKAGVRIMAPMLAIETVAAGGGSVCDFDGVKLSVGPDSAGADPGPACYGRGGPLAVTDLNVYLGKVLPEHFPFALDQSAIERRLSELIHRIEQATGRRYDPLQLCDGYLRVANANMAKAIRSISIAKGYDPRDYVLVSFGGAAAQHACAVARELNIRRVLNHPDAGILSAYGMGLADVTRHAAAGIYRPYDSEALTAAQATFEQLSTVATREVVAEGIPPAKISVVHSLDLRYRGLDSYLTIAEPADGNWQAAYEEQHQQLYGYQQPGRELEIVAARVAVTGRLAEPLAESRPLSPTTPAPEREVTTYFDAAPHTTQVYQRDALKPGDRISGPAIITEVVSTTVIDPGWQADVLSGGELLLTDTEGAQDVQVSTEADPVMLEVFNNQFAGIAEQMGITLRNTSSSVNVKERLDFSCAVFTARGELVVNAPHIPVHLGAMGETVRQILADNPAMQPGDVFVTNDPYRGGSHLPDVTVVTPVHDATDGRLLFFTASRAHHAEIGGIRPGSMPPFSRNLAEEGVLIRNFKLLDRGESRFDGLRELLLTPPYPSRNVTDNLADISAQLAANQQGARDLLRLVERYSLPVVTAYMQHIQAAATQKMQQSLAPYNGGSYSFVDHLDSGAEIRVRIDVADCRARIDFSGTSGVLASNLNANRAIVTAAVMYVMRSLIAEDIPLNEGVLTPLEIVLPESLLNPPAGATPAESPAVVGGNVETSQRVVDVLLGALKLAAASQGTMNNLLFGDSTFGYYETICGGSGATAQGAGADAVHTHMTNTRLTDPEVLERRYPVLLESFGIRRGSGGGGAQRGGDGVTRRIRFLRPLEVSLLTSRRGPYAPYGLAGGNAGALGVNQLIRATGETEQLPAAAQFPVAAGDVLVIQTPGGGGWGSGE